MRDIKNRSVAAVLALLGACGISAALADPPVAGPSAATAQAQNATATSAATTTSATTATSATTTPSATSTAAAAVESDAALEKRLTNSGYKPKMRNGTKVWCKREMELGSHLGGQEVCGTPDELKLSAQRNQDDVKSVQKMYNQTLK